MDWMQIKSDSPDTYQQLAQFFTVSKTTRANSSMGVDQAHEQLNCEIKSVKGALAFLGENKEESLLKWGCYAPDFLAMINEYGNEEVKNSPTKHHEDRPAFQLKFTQNCRLVKSRMSEVFNPFDTNCPLLCRIDNGEQMPGAEKVGSAIRSMIPIGREQFKDFVENRLVKREIAVSAPIHANSLLLPSKIKVSEDKTKKDYSSDDAKLVKSLKNLGPSRKELVIEALQFEPGNEPRVFAQNGSPYIGPKSTILPILEKLGSTTLPLQPKFSAVIIDLSHLVHHVGGQAKGKTIQHLIDVVEKNIAETQRKYSCETVGIATDNYGCPNPLKLRASDGSQYPVELSSLVPTKFHDNFLRNKKNKKLLYDLMIPQIFMKNRNKAYSFSIAHESKTLSTMGLFPDCNHIEADYRIVQFIIESIKRGHTSYIVCTGDTDIVVILVGHFQRLQSRCPDLSITVILKSGKSQRLFDICKIALAIGHEYLRGFLMFWSFTGCDYTPFFYKKGKVKWFDVYSKNEEIRSVFQDLVQDTSLFDMQALGKIVKFVKEGYGVHGESSLPEDRYEVLMKPSTNTFRSLPPSPGAIFVQSKKALFIAAKIWDAAEYPDINYDGMRQYGWKEELGDWKHTWTPRSLPSPDPYVQAMKKCGCKSPCKSGRCSCKTVNKIKCSLICGCRGECIEPVQ